MKATDFEAGYKRWSRWLAAPLLMCVSGIALAQTAAAPEPKPSDVQATAPAPAPKPSLMSLPLPAALSDQARTAITTKAAANPAKDPTLAERRSFLEKFQQTFGAGQRKKYAVDITESVMAGVNVRIISPQGMKGPSKRIFLNLHGGGFAGDSGTLTENIPIAALTGIQVVAVRYRLAPENPFPAQVEDSLAVYRELLKTHKASDIGIYGTSAGAILGPELIMRIRAEKLPMPGVLGVFSGDSDLSRRGDSTQFLGLNEDLLNAIYLGGKTPATDPIVSPLLGDLTGFPPTMCMTSTRDFFLSSTSNLCLALEKAGVENKLVVFDGLPHAFWAYIDAPESDQAFAIMARFLKGRVR